MFALLALTACGDVEDGLGTVDGPTVRFTTRLGVFEVGTYASESPVTADNFVRYAAEGFYDGTDGGLATVVHRIVPGFVVQGGGVTPSGDQKETRDPIVNESSSSGLRNVVGTLSMARFSEPDTATSQFFVNLDDNRTLDPRLGSPGYAVFGEIVTGFDVIEAMAAEDRSGEQPIEPIVIESVEVDP